MSWKYWHLIFKDVVTLMDYRTSAYGDDGIINHALDLLDYAQSTGHQFIQSI